MTVLTLLFLTGLFESLPEATLAAVVVAALVELVDFPGVKILRVGGGLFFANADAVRAQVRRLARQPGVSAVVLDGEAMPFLDVSAARMLQELADDLRRDAVRLLLARDVGEVRDVLRTSGADAGLGRVYPTVQAAVEAATGGSPATGDDDRRGRRDDPRRPDDRQEEEQRE